MNESNVSCRETMEQLWALLDRELDAGDTARLEAHLAACQHCYPEYDFQRAFRSFLAATCQHEAPPELRRRIFMALLEEERGG
jgi:mycothiol system anti-sigma-R factor